MRKQLESDAATGLPNRSRTAIPPAPVGRDGVFIDAEFEHCRSYTQLAAWAWTEQPVVAKSCPPTPVGQFPHRSRGASAFVIQ